MTEHHKTSAARVVSLLALLLSLAGCRQQMADQPSYRPLEASRFFGDGQSARPLVSGTVARGKLQSDRDFASGRRQPTTNGGSDDVPRGADNQPSLERPAEYVDQFPYEIAIANLKRGRERYEIYCAPCHADNGSGRGVIVRHGYPEAQTFHSQRLRTAPIGYYIDVINRGSGKMASYAGQIEPHDRWAIVAYIRAMQKSSQAQIPIEKAMYAILAELPIRDNATRETLASMTVDTDAGSGRVFSPDTAR